MSDQSRSHFKALAKQLFDGLQGEEVLLLNLSGEHSDFVRFNHSKIRQSGHVQQDSLDLELIIGHRHASASCSLSGDISTDYPRSLSQLNQLRELMKELPEDPHLLYNTDIQSTESLSQSDYPNASEILPQILDAGQGHDLVGIYAGGSIYRGFANSLGQENWHATDNFHLDWSLYLEKDKAVKNSYAGPQWNSKQFEQKINWSLQQLEILKQPSQSLKPGQYRAYFSPAALSDFMDMMSWGGFGEKSRQTKQSSLQKLVLGEKKLSPQVHLKENTAEGLAPNFQSQGFIKPDCVGLIQNGENAGSLISPRSAKEYGLTTNGASSSESPLSLEMAGGDLKSTEAAQALGEGLYINNVWYLNYSDHNNCRITGMTRFATFWVKNGQISAPLQVMRFDESIFHLLGNGLEALTQDREWIVDASTYENRSTNSALLPGALVQDFKLTL